MCNLYSLTKGQVAMHNWVAWSVTPPAISLRSLGSSQTRMLRSFAAV